MYVVLMYWRERERQRQSVGEIIKIITNDEVCVRERVVCVTRNRSKASGVWVFCLWSWGRNWCPPP